jgi:hypothetical protein
MTPLHINFISCFNAMASIVTTVNREHGFDDPSEDNVGEKIALMHSELSEGLEAHRLGNPPSEHIPEFSAAAEEYADTIIRIMATDHTMRLKVAEALVAKVKFNMERPYKHGGKKF